MENAFNIKEFIGEATAYDKKQSLELKKVKSWCKSVSAFANGSGGKLLFGIADDNTVVGLDDAQFVAEKFSELVRNHIDPLPDIAISFENIDGKKIMIAEVFAGTTTPYYYKGDGQMSTFIRLGNESVPASVMEIRELVLRGTHQSYDSLVSKYHIKDYDFAKLRSVFKARTGKSFNDNDYESWGLVNEDGMLTNAGALLADDSPIRHSRIFCTRWNGIDKAHSLMDALDDLEVSGSLTWLLQSGMDFCQRNCKKKWRKTAQGRVEFPDYPEDSILEGLVNALIHRNYLEIGSEVHIDIFDNRIEIYSPGGMFDGMPVQNHDLMKVKSKRRNPIIADIFNRLRYMERRGSGFKKICDNYRIQPNYRDNLCPEFYSNQGEFTLTLWNLNYGAQIEELNGAQEINKSTDNEQNIGAANGARSNNLNGAQSGELNGAQKNRKTVDNKQNTGVKNGARGDNLNGARKTRKATRSDETPEMIKSQILEAIKIDPSSTIGHLITMTGLAERTVKKYLKILKEAKEIERIGNNRNGYWQVND